MKKYILLIALLSTIATAQPPFDTMPGTFVRQGEVIWACLPVVRILVCAPISVSHFCQMDRPDYDKGILNCVKPMMAEDKGLG